MFRRRKAPQFPRAFFLPSNIEYQSVNPKFNIFIKDATRLGEIYSKLKKYADELYDILERHCLENLGKVLLKDISEIDRIEHDLIKIAKKIKEEQC